MEIKIRNIVEEDRETIINMMTEFYSSDAVFTNGSIEIFNSDINECLSDSPYAEGFTICDENKLIGYVMIAKSFSTEFGKSCIWIEDIYLLKEYRNMGIAPKIFQHIDFLYPNSIKRLEAEKENEHAVHVYKKYGFNELPYLELKK